MRKSNETSIYSPEPSAISINHCLSGKVRSEYEDGQASRVLQTAHPFNINSAFNKLPIHLLGSDAIPTASTSAQ